MYDVDCDIPTETNSSCVDKISAVPEFSLGLHA